MTKELQTKILYHLHFLRSIGYTYHKNIDFNSLERENLTLPNNHENLKEIVENCHLCNLSKYRENVLFSKGNYNSKIFFLKEYPTISEDELGDFYVGKSGELLKNMLEKSLNVSVDEIYMTNLVKCSPPNGNLTKEHINYCKSYLLKQLDIVKPKLLVIFGENTYSYFTNERKNFNEVRGKVINYFDLDIIATYDPNYLLRNPSAKAEAYKDMLKIKSLMEQM